eukprot:747940_1
MASGCAQDTRRKYSIILKDHHPIFQSVPIMDIERCIQIMGMSHNRENNTFTDSFITETPQRSTQHSPLRSLDPNPSILHQQNVLKSPINTPKWHRQTSPNQSLNANVQSLRIQNNKLQIDNNTLTIANRKLTTQKTTLQTKLDNLKAMKHKQTIQINNIQKAKDQIESRFAKLNRAYIDAVNDLNLLRAQNTTYEHNMAKMHTKYDSLRQWNRIRRVRPFKLLSINTNVIMQLPTGYN